MISGIDTQYIDSGVRAQDDFYRHVNGVWLDTTEIPADKARYGSFDQLFERSLEQLHGLVAKDCRPHPPPIPSSARSPTCMRVSWTRPSWNG